MRKTDFENGEYYHVYNRGVDKRNITLDQHDSDRFVNGLLEFNTLEGAGSLRDCLVRREHGDRFVNKKDPLVEIIAYCLNPNHFHFILKQVQDNGISLFLRSQAGGYSRYFNKKHHRSGTLFEGRFKATWVEDEKALCYKSVYVNRNNIVHQLGKEANILVRSSWSEYLQGHGTLVIPKAVLSHFKNIDEYQKYSNESLAEMLEAKREQKELRHIEYED